MTILLAGVILGQNCKDAAARCDAGPSPQPHLDLELFLVRRQTVPDEKQFDEPMLLALAGSALTPPTLLTCGYTLDGTEIARIEIRRDCKHHLPWKFDIYGGTEVVEPLVISGMDDTAKPAVVTSRKRRPAADADAEEK